MIRSEKSLMILQNSIEQARQKLGNENIKKKNFKMFELEELG